MLLILTAHSSSVLVLWYSEFQLPWICFWFPLYFVVLSCWWCFAIWRAFGSSFFSFEGWWIVFLDAVSSSRNWYALSLHCMFPVFLSLRLPFWCFGFRFVLEVLVLFLRWYLVSDSYLRYLSSSLGGVWFQICTWGTCLLPWVVFVCVWWVFQSTEASA